MTQIINRLTRMIMRTINPIREGVVVTVKQQPTRESVEYVLTRGVAQIEAAAWEK